MLYLLMQTGSTLPERAETVVVGAGVVGCSAAYHLTEHNRKDVVVLDKGPIPKTGGSTVHAPGGVLQSTADRTMSRFAQYSVDLYNEHDAFKQVGSIEVATTPERLSYIKRKRDYSKSWSLKGTELLSPSDVREHVPLINPEEILGGYYIPSDGFLESVELLESLAADARKRGATFHEYTEVTDIEVRKGTVEAVATNRGPIETEEVLVAGNIWAPLIGEMAGVDIPLVPCEHQYAVTKSIDELRGTTEEIEHVPFRHQDGAMYFRQHGEGYGIGSYNHVPRLVDPHDIADHDEAIEDTPVYDYFVGRDQDTEYIQMPANREFTPEDFEVAWDETTRMLPALEGVDLDRAFNGMFCFTPDGMPVLGESAVEGFWVAAAVWITHAGGVGRAIAEWMIDGYPRRDLTGCDIQRFQPHAGSSSYVRERGAYNYDTVYDIVHPREPASSPRGLRRSPFYEHQQDLGAVLYDADGWERPRYFESNESLLDEYDVPKREGWAARFWSPIEGAEHRAVRDRVGLYDLSTFTHIRIEGRDAPALVQRQFANDMDADIGSVTYTPMLTEAGGVAGDMTVVRTATDRFEVFANAGSAGSEQFHRLRERARDVNVSVTNRTSAECAIGVWGPDARALLTSVCDSDISNDAVPYFSAREIHVGSIPVRALRVSYVGELGWELHTPSEYGAQLWETLWEAGREFDAVPMGDGALNTMRLEKGFRLFGADLTPEFGPYEAGLGFAVADETEFVGSDALEGAENPERTLACLTIDEAGEVVLGGVPFFDDADDVVGYATSADYGYSINAGIVYGYLDTAYTDPGTKLYLQYENERYPATVREEPLFDPDRERILR